MMKRVQKNRSLTVCRGEDGFSLVEVIVALAITLLVLTALLNLQIRSTKLAAQTSMDIRTLPVAITAVEEVIQTPISGGRSEKNIEEYTVIAEMKDVLTGIDSTRTKVEVYYNDEPYSELSVYDFQ